jgi:ATP-dependent exoDNAse (exonuclease V) beta subunit
MNSFIERNPEYSDFYRIARSYDNFLYLIKSLASKGIIPEKEGWYQNTEEFLDGDKQKFMELFKEANKPRDSKNGKRQSELRSRLYSYRYKNFPEEAPEEEEIRGGYGTKRVRKDFGEKAFEEDREHLKAFEHDIYFEYVRYCLSRNYLNFSFLMMFAYVLLREDSYVRRQESFEYMMIDEFQDTNPLQFKLALLLADRPNIAVVGDWKQSIYSFQYASVENIQEFRTRLKEFKGELNQGAERVSFSVDNVTEIELMKNYRSSQDILDFADQSLMLPANQHERPDEKDVTGLESMIENQESSIETFVAAKEVQSVLTKIQDVVDNEEYTYGDEDRKLEYRDIAVLTRTRGFGLELQEKAREYGIPVAYEGGVELFKTNPALLLLAWLRILNNKHSRKGWAVVLEESGYLLEEAKKILDEDEEEYNYPQDMLEFREELEGLNSVKAVAGKVFQKYGYSNGFTDKVIEVLSNVFTSSYMNLGELIQFIEENIEENEIYEVDTSRNRNTVKIQTIHAAKGLEYPAVFISDVNQGKFPSKNSDSKAITYQDPVGLRQRKIYMNSGYAFEYDNWRSEVLMKCLSGNYDEERRLMYVAMTRAEQHLFITAQEDRASTFFKGLSEDPELLEADVENVDVAQEDLELFEVEGSFEERPELRSVHSELELVEGDSEKGKEIHRFAEKYVKEDIEPSNEKEREIKEFIDSLEGELRAEVRITTPRPSGNYSGVIDLLHLTDEKIEVIDYKTDSHPENMEEYRKQVELYREGLEDRFDRPVESRIVNFD